MPHSNFKSRATEFNTGVESVPADREMAMELQMHHKFCSKPPVAFNKIGVPKKAMTMREQQLNEYERMRLVHN